MFKCMDGIYSVRSDITGTLPPHYNNSDMSPPSGDAFRTQENPDVSSL